MAEQRLEQAVDELFKGFRAEIFMDDKNLESITKWMLKDVGKESKLEKSKGKLQWKQIEPGLAEGLLFVTGRNHKESKDLVSEA